MEQDDLQLFQKMVAERCWLGAKTALGRLQPDALANAVADYGVTVATVDALTKGPMNLWQLLRPFLDHVQATSCNDLPQWRLAILETFFHNTLDAFDAAILRGDDTSASALFRQLSRMPPVTPVSYTALTWRANAMVAFAAKKEADIPEIHLKNADYLLLHPRAQKLVTKHIPDATEGFGLPDLLGALHSSPYYSHMAPAIFHQVLFTLSWPTLRTVTAFRFLYPAASHLPPALRVNAVAAHYLHLIDSGALRAAA